MPAYSPETKEEILQSLVMRMVALSELSDLRENSGLTTMLGVVAERFEEYGARLADFHDAHHFRNVSGSLARDRVGQLPNGGLGGQLPESPAYGRVLQLTRSDPTAALEIAAGDVLVGRSDNPNVVYQLTELAPFAAGEIVTDPDNLLRIICLTPGEVGNCPIGAIDRVIKAPDGVELGATNVDALSTGQPAESVAQYVKRGEAYLASLAGRPQTAPLEYLATTFRSSTGVRAKNAKVHRDPIRPGYAELTVDDGFAFDGFTRPGVATTGTAPISGQAVLWFEGPAATTPEIYIDGVKLEAQYGVEPDWKVEHELGRVVFKDSSTMLAPGAVWEVKNYDVFTDFIAELQALVLGETDDPNEPGWVASGNRLRVIPPRSQDLALKIIVWLVSGYRLEDVEPAIQEVAVAHVATLAADDPFRPFRLYGRLSTQIEGVEDIEIVTPEGPQWPAAGRRWSTRAAIIDVTSGG